MVNAMILKLPRGGKVIKCRVTMELSRYDLIAVAIHARSQGERLTRSVCIQYMRRMLENYGVEWFLETFNKATDEQRVPAEEAISRLFPELN